MPYTSVSESGEEIVMVPVPRRHLSAVYRTLATEMGPTAGGGSPSSAETASAHLSDDGWTKDEILRLKRMIRTTTPRVIMDLTTSRLNELISLRDVEVKAGRTYEQARADLGGFTRLIKGQFHKEKWPFKVEYGPGGFAAYYCDSADIADWWQER